MNNPLLKASKCPFGTIPFKDIKFEHFLPAISSCIKYATNTHTPVFYLYKYTHNYTPKESHF